MSGGAFAVYGWFVEQLLAVSGAYYTDNGNGRDAAATEAVFNSPEGVKILQWWKDMYDSGSFGNYGRTTVDTRNAFLAGQTAMFIDSTAVLRGMIDGSEGSSSWGPAGCRGRTRPRLTSPARSSAAPRSGSSTVARWKSRNAPGSSSAS